jgi:pilus assembly protein Flp/PilA
MMLRALFRDDKGATAVEYSLVAIMISVACIAGMQAIGSSSNTGWHGVLSKSKDVLGY